MPRLQGPTGRVRSRWTTFWGVLVAAVLLLNSSVVVVAAARPDAALRITVTAPTGTGTYAVGSRLTVSWITPSVISTGEFGVWVQSATGVRYVETTVPPSRGVNHTTALTLAVPAGSGYRAVVAWRPTIGRGDWAGVTTSPGSFTVTDAPSSAKAITAFSFTSPAATGVITEGSHTIAVSVPYGTIVTALVATFTTTGASVAVGGTVQTSGTTPNDFTSPLTYTVTAADDTTMQAYVVTVTIAALAIGDAYQGGIVAYILQSGDPGYVAGETHGLIAATADQSAAIIWAKAAYDSTAVPGGTSTAIGSGSANTTRIVAQNGAGTTYAAGRARAYRGGGYTDWYLPSMDELNKLYLNRDAIGGLASAPYWSSSVTNRATAWGQNFRGGDQYGYDKSLCVPVRAVRGF